MKYHKQKYKHDPDNKIYGDCFRTAIACILDLERDDVPHFMDGDPPSEIFWPMVSDWLASQGYTLFSIPYNDTLENLLSTMKNLNPDVYYMLAGKSPRGTEHQVIALNDEIIHDPAIDGGGLIGPCEDGYYWVDVILPISMRYKK